MQGIARLLLGAQVRAGLAELNGNCMLSGDCCALVYRDSAWHCRRAVLLLQSCVRIVCCAGGNGPSWFNNDESTAGEPCTCSSSF